MADQAFDYSKLSDDELDNMVRAKQNGALSQPAPGTPNSAAPSIDYGKLSEEELNQLVMKKAQGNPVALETSDPNQPKEADLYASDKDRAASSYGDDAGISDLIKKNGFVEVTRNKNGDIVAKGKDGLWYKDPDNFFSKESGVAGLIPDHPLNWAEARLGKALPVLGMGAGGTIGAGAGPAGAIGGAVAGGAAGEASRIAAGKYMGVYKGGAGDVASDLAKEGLESGVGEMGGQVVSKTVGPYVKPYIDTAVENASNAIKKGVSAASSFATGVPRDATERLIERPAQVMTADAKGNALRVATAARQELLDRNTSEKAAIGAARKAAVEKYGQSPIDTDAFRTKLSQILEDNAPEPGIEGALSHNDNVSLEDMKDNALVDPDTGESSRSFGSMQKFTDELQRKIDFDRSQLPGGSRYQGILGSLRGSIKDSMHEVSPELAAADAKFSNYADNASRLGRLEDEDSMESFINNFYGKNKSIMRQSAAQVIPGASNDIADLGASRAFTAQGPAGSDFGRRAIYSSGTGLAVAAGMHGSPLGMALGAATAASTSPQVHKFVLGNASKAVDAVRPAIQAALPVLQRGVLKLMPQEIPVAAQFISNNRFLTAVEKAKAADSINRYGEVPGDIARKAVGGQVPPQLQNRIQPDQNGAMAAALKKNKESNQ